MGILFNAVGILGMICFLVAYFFLQKGICKYDSYQYLWMNLIGAVFILTSLSWNWNLPAFLLETAWFFITAYGIYTRWRNDKGKAT